MHLCYGQNHGKSLKNTVHFHGISDLAVVGGHLIFVLKAFPVKILTNYLLEMIRNMSCRRQKCRNDLH